ncbi:unnamed protein product [Bemisia tabaci]|uniref:Ig-like domain-containing protein n=1 Tax=Bemisia tabaci TaxID=7038 RepID=A0A9P0F4D2_BEMTA|nr:unnamed protein product [Bemisia tabaci]
MPVSFNNPYLFIPRIDTKAYQRHCILRCDVLLYPGSLLYIGPSFFKEPPPQADFANDTGVRLDCAAGGSPVPSVSWLYGDGKPVNPIPQILELLPNGSIHFLPFAPSSYRIDVHSNTYRCQAANLVGRIVSRDVRVRAEYSSDMRRISAHISRKFYSCELANAE